MGTFIRGGWSKIEYDDNVGLSTPTEIPNILKDGTSIEFETPVEALGNENEASAGKKAKVTIRSSDLTPAVYTELVTAEAALTPMWFKLTGINVAQNYKVGPCVPRVEFDPQPAGKFHARKITAVGFGVTEAGIVTVTLA